MITVLLPTLNEVKRIKPCLDGLIKQSAMVKKIVIIDGGSTDGTLDLIYDAQTLDPRIELVHEPALPPNWIGKPWALHYGFSMVQTPWVLTTDADTEWHPNLSELLYYTAKQAKIELLSAGPKFISASRCEQVLHCSLLTTLLYRFGSPSLVPPKKHAPVLANGMCLLVKTRCLQKIDGFSVSRNSFCDDVTLAAKLHKNGVRIAIVDGSDFIKVRMYASLSETWREWGRSIDLKDSITKKQLLWDVIFLSFTLGVPIPIILFMLPFIREFFMLQAPFNQFLSAIFIMNLWLIMLRFTALLFQQEVYQKIYPSYWVTPFFDCIGVIRFIISAYVRPKSWRGRIYKK